jgi:hypothetical protein
VISLQELVFSIMLLKSKLENEKKNTGSKDTRSGFGRELN